MFDHKFSEGGSFFMQNKKVLCKYPDYKIEKMSWVVEDLLWYVKNAGVWNNYECESKPKVVEGKKVKPKHSLKKNNA